MSRRVVAAVLDVLLFVVVATGCLAAVAWRLEMDARHERPLALCPNFDSTRVVAHRWDYPESSRVVRTIPAPSCEVVP